MNLQSRNCCHCPHTRGRGVSERESVTWDSDSALAHWPPRAEGQAPRQEEGKGGREVPLHGLRPGQWPPPSSATNRTEGPGAGESPFRQVLRTLLYSSPMTWSTGWTVTPRLRTMGRPSAKGKASFLRSVLRSCSARTAEVTFHIADSAGRTSGQNSAEGALAKD